MSGGHAFRGGTRRVALAAIVAGSLAVFLGEGGAQSPASSLAGCYAIEVGSWSPPYDPDRHVVSIPLQVRLRSAAIEDGRGWEEGRSVDVLGAQGEEWPADLAFRSWVARGDSVDVSLSTGYDGYRVKVTTGRSTTLRGTITAWHDVDVMGGSGFPEAPVTLRPIACEGERAAGEPTRGTCDVPADGFLFGVLPGVFAGMMVAVETESNRTTPLVVGGLVGGALGLLVDVAICSAPG